MHDQVRPLESHSYGLGHYLTYPLVFVYICLSKTPYITLQTLKRIYLRIYHALFLPVSLPTCPSPNDLRC